MADRIKLALVAIFFIVLLVVTGTTQKDVLKQKDPTVLNFLAAGYCPGIVQSGQQKPLEELNRIKHEWERLVVEQYMPAGRPGFDRPWKVRYLEMPNLGEARESWALTRLMGGMAPEFMWSQSIREYTDQCNQWFVDLSPYLNQPNHYVPGNKRWIDLFYPGVLDNWRATADRHLYCIPIDQVEIAIYYNRNIMAECGIDIEAEVSSPDWDWHRFMEIHRIIQDHPVSRQKGYVPFLMTGSDQMRLGWLHDIINDMLYAELYDQLNAVDDPDTPDSTSVDAQEKIRALKKGIVSLDDERYWECWRLIKEWSQYWQRGYLGTGDLLFFQRGNAAMAVDGSWYIKNLENDQMRSFEYGTFFVPRITKRTSRFAIGAPPRGVGGATAIQYSITRQSAERKGAVEACVDLLMFISAPQNLGPMVAEGRSFLPAVRGCERYFEGSPLKFMLPVLEAGPKRFSGLDDINVRCRDEWFALLQKYLADGITRDQVIVQMKRAVDRAIEDQLTRYRDIWKWEVDENGQMTWEITPPVSKLSDEFRPTTRSGAGPRVFEGLSTQKREDQQ